MLNLHHPRAVPPHRHSPRILLVVASLLTPCGLPSSAATAPPSGARNASQPQPAPAAAQTYTISGRITCGLLGFGIPGIALYGLPGDPETNSDGYYTATVPEGWSGAAFPQFSGLHFDPPFRNYNNVTSNITHNYKTALPETIISGYVRTAAGEGIGGVTMSGLHGTPVTNYHGFYLSYEGSSFSGTVTPQKTGYTFTPTSRTYQSQSNDVDNANFTGSQQTSTPGITITPTSGLQTTEAGGTAQFTVVLATQPTANVTVGFSSSDTTEGTVSPASLTFTSSNWNTPQTVTVTGVNDPEADGDIAYAIVTAPATSTDPSYSGLKAADAAVTNLDNESLRVTPAGTVDFGTVAIGQTKELDAYTVTNVGDGTVTGTVAVSAPFSILSGGTFSLAKDQSQVVRIRFAPTASGQHTQTVSFTSDGGNTSRIVTGASPLMEVHSNNDLDFGRVVIGNVGQLTDAYTVTNTGAGTLDVTVRVAAPFHVLGDGGLPVNELSFSLGAGAQRKLSFNFAPFAPPQQFSETIYFVSNGGNDTRTATGVGVLPQTFSLTSPTSGTFPVGQPITIQWTASGVIPGSTISLCYDSDTTWANGNEHWIEIDCVAAADGSGSWVWNTRGVPPGRYYLTGYMFDWDSTYTISHLTQSITLAAPSFVLTGPTSGTYAVGDNVTIQWTAGNVLPGSTISLCYDEDKTWLNGNEHWIEIDMVQAANGSGSYVWNTRGVAPGTYYLAGYMYDWNGTAMIYHLTQSITIAAQSFTLTGPTSGTYTVGQEVTIAWTAANVRAGSSLSLCYDEDTTWLNGNEHWIVIDALPVSAGSGSWKWNTRGVAPGTYTIAGYMYDGNGRATVSHLTQAITLVAGTPPPVTVDPLQSFALTGPTSGTYSAGALVPITWTVAHVTARSTISLCYDADRTWMNGNEHWIEVDRASASNGTGTWLWNTRGVAPGTYYIAGYMYDGQGTYRISQLTQPVTIAAPSFALSGPTSGTYAVGDSVTVRWTAGNVRAGSTISLCCDADTTWLNGNEHWIEIDMIQAASGSGSYVWNTRGVAPGTYYLAGYMYDWNGTAIVSQLSQPITIVAQSFALSGPTSGTYTVGQAVAITWTSANLPAGATVSLCYDEDTTWWNGNEHWIEVDSALASAGTWLWNTRGVAPGTYYLAGYTYDRNGAWVLSHLADPITLAP